MEEVPSRVSRRRLIRTLGMGGAAAWFAPIVTSLSSTPERICEACNVCPGWTCHPNHPPCVCGLGCGPLGVAYCTPDVDGNCFCWEDWPCSDLTDCTHNSDCPFGYACIPNTCCGTAAASSAGRVGSFQTSDRPVPSKCLPACGLGRRTRRPHGRTTSGRIL